MLLSLLMLAIIIAGAVLLDQGLFRVRALVVHGCQTRPAEEVTALSQIEYGQSIFKVDLQQVAHNVQSSPYFRVEEAVRLYPDRIKLVVHERRPRAVTSTMGSFLIMDEGGFVLEVRSDSGYTQCPMVEGLKIGAYGVGQQLTSTDGLQLKAMQGVLEALDEQQATQYISLISLDNVMDIRMTTVDGYRVMLGDFDDLNEKLNWLGSALSTLRAEGMFGGTIYLSVNNASYLQAGHEEPEDAQELAWPQDGFAGEEAADEGPEPAQGDPQDEQPDPAADRADE